MLPYEFCSLNDTFLVEKFKVCWKKMSSILNFLSPRHYVFLFLKQ